MKRVWVAFTLLLASSPLLASCIAEPDSGHRGDLVARNSLVLGIHHQLKTSDAVAYPGRLVLYNGCVMLRPRDGSPLEMVAWPEGFTGHPTYRGFHVVDGQDRTVASNGDRVVLGGEPIGANAIRSSTGGDLPARCAVSHLIAVDDHVRRVGRSSVDIPADWRVSLRTAERGAAFSLLLPHHPSANQGNVTHAYLFPQGLEVALLFPMPAGTTTTDPTRPPFIEILEEPWSGGKPIHDFKHDLEVTPAVGKTICHIDRRTPALCVKARSPSDSRGNNAAYLRFVTGGVQVQVTGGEELQRLIEIAKTLS